MTTPPTSPPQRPSARHSGDQTTWELGEFEAHMRRLERVSLTVKTASEQVHQCAQDTKEAYGALFGWAVMPFVKGLSDSTSEFATSLHDGLEESRAAIKKTHDAYTDQETGAARASDAVHTAVDQAPRDRIAREGDRA